MRIPSWLARLKKLLGWPLLMAGGIIWIVSTTLDVRDIASIGLPTWVWQLIAPLLIFISIVSILYQFQRQLDSVPTIGQKGQTNNFPKRPNYKIAQVTKAKEFIDKFIKIGEELKARIQPDSLDNIGEIRSEIAKFALDVGKEIWRLIPEYSDFFNAPIVLNSSQYNGWLVETAEESKKVDRLLSKLKLIRLQL